ncbi:MAG: membrane protein insertase YidC [Spirochaetaceae bacterium]
MDRRTVIAVVLSVIVITVGFMLQNILFPPPEPTPLAEQQPGTGDDRRDTPRTEPIEPDEEETQPRAGDGAQQESLPEGAVAAVPADDISDEPRVYENGLVRIEFDPAGGAITSYRLLDHLDEGEPVEMIFRGTEEQRAFQMAFGTTDTAPTDDLFRYRDTTDPHTVEFYREFYIVGQEDRPFTVRRIYRFQPGEYLFELEIVIENSVNEFIPLNFAGTAYTLNFGPQIGPEFESLDGRNEYRNFYTYDDGKRDTLRISQGDRRTLDETVRWVSIVGKYFTAIAVPGAANYGITLSSEDRPGIPVASQMYFERPVIRSASNSDVFRFYLGPKTNRFLERYNNAEDNAWGTRGLELQETVDSRFLLGWLENVLKWILNTIYRVIPNYGVAIIILTIIVKALLYPLTRKSFESTAKMQTLQPKMQELREKYKDNPQKLNQEMAAMYKKEGVNPLGGCLPLLLQFPFFIAMFGLFNNHFDLRGATFIPGWISDLSAPESILSFGDFTLPLLGWTDLRLLPIVFVGSQLVTSHFMQSPNASGGQAKMIQYMLPIVFFFVLYNMPSGLLVYWITTNILTGAQQFYKVKIKSKRATT